jgi:DNA polymerase-3 subunit gamma/tau
MEYQVSARKYRPGTFADVIGQPHVVQTLVNSITSQRIAHAFLFSGTRGVGKTTVARILAKALNCERGPTGSPCDGCPSCLEIAQGSSVDVIEIDGASNTGVDDVREIRENVKFTPFRGHYRVYIIDEVHMLSNSAFNALLKTLEEPPPHVVFVFATTEIHKIPATILSRCQHYNFRRISRTEIIKRLRHVATQDGLSIEDRSLAALARASEGSMRDALSLLDQAIAFSGNTIRHDDLQTLLGAVPHEQVRAMIAAVVAQDGAAAVRVIASVLDQGHDLRAYCADLVEYLRHMLVIAIVPAAQRPDGLHGLVDLPDEELHQAIADADALTAEQLQEVFRIVSQAEDQLRVTSHPRFLLEAAAVRATRLVATTSRTSAIQPATTPAQSARQAGGAGPHLTASPPLPAREAGPRPGAPTPSRSSPPKPPEGAPRSTSPSATLEPRSSTPTRSSPSDPPKPVVPASPTLAPAPVEAHVGPPTAEERAAAIASWERIVEQMESRHPNIAPFLAMGRVAAVEEHRLVVAYPLTASVAAARLQKEDAIKAVADACLDVLGRRLRLHIDQTVSAETSGPSLAQQRAEKERAQKQTLLEHTRAHPLVRQATELFGGQVVDVRPAPSGEENA